MFRHDIAAAGVHHPTPPLAGGAPTARCLILVTPDGQRTMSTFLGASVAFEDGDVDEALVADSAVTYLEGYLFDPPAAQAAFRKAALAARRAGRQVALSLSDPFCVARHRAAFLDLLREGVDLVFANEAEITSLYETASFDEAAKRVAAEVPLCALTRGPQGSVILRGAEQVLVAAEPARVVDTTGAGDAYAAGFLAAYTAGQDLAACGRLGSLAAASVIAQLGARPLAGLRNLAAPMPGLIAAARPGFWVAGVQPIRARCRCRGVKRAVPCAGMIVTREEMQMRKSLLMSAAALGLALPAMAQNTSTMQSPPTPNGATVQPGSSNSRAGRGCHVQPSPRPAPLRRRRRPRSPAWHPRPPLRAT